MFCSSTSAHGFLLELPTLKFSWGRYLAIPHDERTKGKTCVCHCGQFARYYHTFRNDHCGHTCQPVIPVARWGEQDYLAASGEPMQLPGRHPDLPALWAHISSPQQAMEVYRLLQLYAARQNLQIVTLTESPQGVVTSRWFLRRLTRPLPLPFP